MCILCFVMQVMLCALLLHEVDVANNPEFGEFPKDYYIVFARFVCGIALHKGVKNEIFSGMQNMKFVLNHDYRFDSVGYAFLAGLMQVFCSMLIEVVNLLTILQRNTVIDIVMNFMALAVIIDFDDFFFSALGKNFIKKIITDQQEDESNYKQLYMITKTTSKEARGRVEYIPEHELTTDKDVTLPLVKNEKNGKIEVKRKHNSIFVEKWNQKKSVRFYRIIYRLFRIVFVTIWFYFFPFATFLGSYMLPYWYRTDQSLSSTSFSGIFVVNGP